VTRPLPPNCERIDRIVVIHDYATAEGGAGTLALMAAREYRKAGLRVTFFAGGSGEAQGDLEDVELVTLNAKPLLGTSTAVALRQGLHNRGARDALRAWIQRHDTARTIYHLHNWSQILSPAIFEALRPVEHRTVVTCHDFFNACPNGGFIRFRTSEPCEHRPLSLACLATQCDRRSALHKYWRTARHMHLQRVARFGSSRATFTFLHERMRTRFIEAGFAGSDLRVIPNPVEPWSLHRIAAEKNRQLLFVGRVGRDKGADIAVAAADAANMAIAVAGTGELVDDLAKRFPRASMLGWCDRQRIAAAARQSRALIVPSRVIEPFGLVILEAAMCGLPVIVSERAYLAEDAVRDGFGIAFDPADPKGLARDLGVLASSDALVAEMSRNGFLRAARHAHSPDGWASAFLDIFEEKIGSTATFRRRPPPPA
jgi:glycosyltransferase involved in cell wall biosynthesis